jgi:class 3 adenylate cyclase
MTERVCAKCGTPNMVGAKFCNECGHALAAGCPQCGAPVLGGRFCSECGSPLATGADGHAAAPPSDAAPATSAPVAERRVVSMLFGDLVGFTPIAESHDAEAVREMLSAYFDRARAVVERYGGVVEKFIGDAVFAVWGVPVAREDDAERAVRAGLDLTSAVTALGEELGIGGLQMRVGITTGQVAVTLGAVGEGMVAGDAVNTAARVQSVASPSQVWVDDTTRSLTTASLAYDSVGSHELKGKSHPVELFHAIRTTAGLGGEQRVDGLEAPFVGRDRELRLVKELFHATAEEGRSRLVLVAGEAGIGKSRLAWEFEKYVDAIPTTTSWWMRARCLSYGEGVAGRVVAELVRYLLRLTDADDEATARLALDTRLRQHVADEAEREVLRPRLESLLGLSDEVFEQSDLFACWRAFLEALPDERATSVTMVIEDFQWADDGLHKFLAHVLESARAAIMILLLSRPEVAEEHPGIGVGRRATTVFLEPLPDPAMSMLLDGLVADLHKDLRTELVQRAEGIPLYAVETVRALIDRDVAVPMGGRYVVDPGNAASLDLAALGPPASLQALLAARLDALPDAERRIVQDASVLGMSFTQSGIASLTPPGVDLDAALESLRHREILTVDNDPRSPERGQFRFVQAVLRGVAYDTLSRRDRRARHLAVADYLSAAPDADATAGVVAAHCLDALESMPDASDSAELTARASTLLEQAALHATAIGSPALALSHYARLMSLDPPDDVVIRVTVAAAGLTARVGSKLDRALEWTERGLAAAERSGTEDDTLSLQLAAARLLIARGSVQEALPLSSQAFDACLGRPDRISALAVAARQLCLCAQYSADPELAQRAAFGALADIERFGNDEDFAAFLDTAGIWFSLAGYRRLAPVVYRAATVAYGDRGSASIPPLINLAAGVMHDDPREGQRAAAESIDRARRVGVSSVAALANYSAGAWSTGGWSEAIEMMQAHVAEGTTSLLDWETFVAACSACFAWGRDDRTVMIALPAEETEDPVVRGWRLMHEAVAAALAGDLRQAGVTMISAADATGALRVSNEDMPLCYALAVEILLAAGMTAELDELTTRLEAIPPGQLYRLMHGMVLRVRALLDEGPAAGLRAAIAVFDGMGAAFWAARVRVELAAALADTLDPAAAELLDAAEPALAAAGATRVLRELSRVRERLAPDPAAELSRL